MRLRMSHWVATVFCAFISLVALFGSVTPETSWWRPTFFAFLPMCFFYVGCVTSRLHRDLEQLRRRVEVLEQAPDANQER